MIGLRDRALIGVMAFGFSRISAIVNLRVKDYVQQGRRAFLRTHGKGGVEVDIPVHHELAAYLDAYIAAAELAGDKDGYLFRSAKGKTKQLTTKPMSRIDAWKMVQRRLDGRRYRRAQRLWLPLFQSHLRDEFSHQWRRVGNLSDADGARRQPHYQVV